MPDLGADSFDDHGAPRTSSNGQGEGVAFVLTHEIKRRLRICGYSDNAISHMTPQEAHAILAQAGWSPAINGRKS